MVTRNAPSFAPGSLLLCPCCESEYLHHNIVECFNRKEDEKVGIHTTVDDKVVKIDGDLGKNPSSRRHGTLITFWCENCNASPVLHISQHKGSTIVLWEF